MSFEIRTTKRFDKDAKALAKKYHSFGDDLADLVTTLADNPIQGEPLGRDCYKVRLAIRSKGKGKSGGSRAITCVKVVDEVIHLLAIYDKSDEDTITERELTERLKEIS